MGKGLAGDISFITVCLLKITTFLGQKILLLTMNKCIQNGHTKVKISLLGSSAVGKTSIISAYLNPNRSLECDATTAIDLFLKTTSHKGQKYRLQLWDSVDQDKFMFLTTNFMRNADCSLIVLDLEAASQVVQQEILQNYLRKEINKWNALFRQHNIGEGFPILVGNKNDLKSGDFTSQRVGKVVEEFGLKYIEVSARTGQNIDYLFKTVIEDYQQKVQRKSLRAQRKRRSSESSAEDIRSLPDISTQKLSNYELSSSERQKPLSSYSSATSPSTKTLVLKEKRQKKEEREAKECQCMIM